LLFEEERKALAQAIGDSVTERLSTSTAPRCRASRPSRWSMAAAESLDASRPVLSMLEALE
jgi:hypothetical protein